jgi:hypothetical protein
MYGKSRSKNEKNTGGCCVKACRELCESMPASGEGGDRGTYLELE